MNRHEGQRSVVDDTSALTVEEDILLLQSALSANTGNEVCLSSPCAWRKQPSEDLMLVKHAFPTIHFLSHLFLNVSLDIGLEVNTQIFILCLNHLLATQCLLWALGGNDKRTSAGLSKGQREMAIVILMFSFGIEIYEAPHIIGLKIFFFHCIDLAHVGQKPEIYLSILLSASLLCQSSFIHY